jgi:protein gp37
MSTKIEWTDETWNPVTGCSKVSQGCKNCYAERLWPKVEGARVKREGGAPRPFTHVSVVPDRLTAPLHWTKPRLVFVNSMSDLFHEHVPDSFLDRVFAVMRRAHDHVFQVLTKRPERMLEYVSTSGRDGRVFLAGQHVPFCAACDLPRWPLPNVWLGVSVEDQATADERIPLLLQTPAAVRWISAEPLLGPIDLLRRKIRAGPTTSRARPASVKVNRASTGSSPAARAVRTRGLWTPTGRDRCETSARPPAWRSSSSSGVSGRIRRMCRRNSGAARTPTSVTAM